MAPFLLNCRIFVGLLSFQFQERAGTFVFFYGGGGASFVWLIGNTTGTGGQHNVVQATPAVAKWHGSIKLEGGLIATLHGALITAPWVRGLREGFSRSCVLPIISDQNGPKNCQKNFWLLLATVFVGGGGGERFSH